MGLVEMPSLNKSKRGISRAYSASEWKAYANLSWRSLWRRIYYAAPREALYYSKIKLLISRQEFFDWVFANRFKLETLSHPSIDRIDSAEHYSLSNIQIIEHSENTSKAAKAKYYKTERGISFCKRQQQWRACLILRIPNRYGCHIGYFATKEEALASFSKTYYEWYGTNPF